MTEVSLKACPTYACADSSLSSSEFACSVSDCDFVCLLQSVQTFGRKVGISSRSRALVFSNH